MYFTIVSENTEIHSHTCLPANGKLSVNLENIDENKFQEAIISAGVPELEIPTVREFVLRNKVVRRSIMSGNTDDVRRKLMSMFKDSIIDYITNYIVVKDPNKPASCILNGTLITYQPDGGNSGIKDTKDTNVSVLPSTPQLTTPVSVNVNTTKKPRKPIHKKPTFVIALITTIINAIVSSGILTQIHTNNSTLATILSIIVTVVSALEHYNESD